MNKLKEFEDFTKEELDFLYTYCKRNYNERNALEINDIIKGDINYGIKRWNIKISEKTLEKLTIYIIYRNLNEEVDKYRKRADNALIKHKNAEKRLLQKQNKLIKFTINNNKKVKEILNVKSN